MWRPPGKSRTRFRLSPRRILGKAYERRPSVTELLVGDWLALYEKKELLKLYTVGGTTYAEWTNYMGDPPSQRHFHSCPEPPWSTHKHTKACKFRDDAEPTKRGRPAPTSVPTPTPTQPVVPEVAPGYPSVPSVPAVRAVPSVRSVPAVPADTAQSDNQTAREDPPPIPHDTGRPGWDRPEPLVDGRRPELESEWLRLVREIAAGEKVAVEDVPPEWDGRRGLNPADLSPKRLMRDLIDLRARRARLEPKEPERRRDEKPPDENALFDKRHKLADEFVAWYQANPDAGAFEGRPMWGAAFGLWPRGKELPLWVSSAVFKVATALLTAAAPHPPKVTGAILRKGTKEPLCDVCSSPASDARHGAA